MDRFLKFFTSVLLTLLIVEHSFAGVYPLLLPQGYDKSNFALIIDDIDSQNVINQIYYPGREVDGQFFRASLIQSYKSERRVDSMSGLDINEPYEFNVLEMAGISIATRSNIYLSLVYEKPYAYHTKVDMTGLLSERKTSLTSFTGTLATQIKDTYLGIKIKLLFLEHSEETIAYEENISNSISGDGHGFGFSLYMLRYFKKASLCIKYDPSSKINSKIMSNEFIELPTGSTSNTKESISVIFNYYLMNNIKLLFAYTYNNYPMGYDYYSNNEAKSNFI